MILHQALILSAERDYVKTMRHGLAEMGDEDTRIDVEMDALRAMQLAPRLYDLILLDAMMDAMDGIQLLQLMKLQAPGTRFVLVSDDASEEARAHAYQNGADFYLMRPRTADDFRIALKDIAAVFGRTREGHAPDGAIEEPAQRLTDIVQTHCLSGDSVILLVRSRFQSGDIFIYRGEVFHAQYPGRSGLGAFYDMVHWDDGLVRVKVFRLTNIPPRTIELPYRALLEGAAESIPTDSDLRSPHPHSDGGEPPDFKTVTLEAPALPEEPAVVFPVPQMHEIEMPEVNSYWKVNLTGELLEGSRVTDPDRCAFITTFLYRKMADIAVALEVDYFDTLTLLGPHQQQVLVADNFGVSHAVFDVEWTREEMREQFVEWCREQSL